MVDPRAASGFAASSAGAYARARPAYPADAVAHAVTELGLTPAGTVLDLAAGTGKLTRLLVPLAKRVVAVEPSEAMLAEQGAGVETLVGTAEAIPVADGSVDAVTVAEAFHWFAAAEATREIARVLGPRGGLALLFNRARWTADDLPWIEQFRALVMPYRDAAGPWPSTTEQWQAGLDASGLFAPLRRAEFDNVQRTDAQGFADMVSTWSWVANIPGRERADVLARIVAMAGGGEVVLRYRTEVFCTRTR